MDDFSHRVEQSLRTKFKTDIFSKFTKAIRKYRLIKPGDRIAVCVSGGKDSMLMAKCFQELKRQDKFPFDVKYMAMDPGYTRENRKLLEENASRLDIPVRVFESDIFKSVSTTEKSPCYLCARMRRGYLYRFAKDMGCNKIALGHHYDDVIETILMSMLCAGQMQTMMPKIKSRNFENMELIRPMYLVREKSIKAWRDYHGLHFLDCACIVTAKNRNETENTDSSAYAFAAYDSFGDENTAAGTAFTEPENGGARRLIKEIIRELRKTNPAVEANIFHSVENVALDAVISYKKDGVLHSFLDDYDS